MSHSYPTAALWSLLGAAWSQGGSLLANLLVARALGPLAFGQYSAAQATVTLFVNTAQLEQAALAQRLIAESRPTDTHAAASIARLFLRLLMWLGLLSALLFLLFWAYLRGSTPTGADFGALDAILLAAVVALLCSNTAQVSILLGYEAHKRLAILRIVQGASTLMFTVAGAVAGGLTGALAGFLVAAGIRWLSFRLGVGATLPAVVADAPPLAMREVIRKFGIVGQALPMLLSSFSPSMAQWASIAVVVAASGYAAVGEFAVANNVRLLVVFVPMVLGSVSAPALSRLIGGAQFSDYWRLLVRFAALALGLAAMVSIAIALASAHLLGLVGAEFSAARTTLLVLCGVAVIEVGVTLINQALLSRRRLWQSLLGVTLLRDIVMLAVTWSHAEEGAIAIALGMLAGWAAAGLVGGYFLLEIARSDAVPAGRRSAPSRVGP